MDKLVINNLFVSVDSKMILKGINLNIKKGEIHALIGPNGEGKSTLLSSIMGHPKYKIEEGKIFFKEELINDVSVEKRSTMGLFFAMQNPIEIEGVSNMDFLKGSINARREKPINLFEFIKNVEKNAKETGFDLKLAQRNLNEGFSGGEKKRNELFQMKMLNPDLALIDEIDSGLDVDGFNIITREINKLRDDNFSAIIVSHHSKIYHVIKPDYVHVIMDGKIVETGDEKLLERVENEGYSFLEKKYKNKKENSRQKSIGICFNKGTENKNEDNE